MYRHTATFKFGPYTVDSYGHGAAYGITDDRDGSSIWFQGDDARQFGDEMIAAEYAERPIEDLIDDYADIFESVG